MAKSESRKTPAGESVGRAVITPLADRKVVFISHANPEDNAITAWYGARLAGAGYEVWTDLTRLLGGEEMWLDVDDALRFHARKVIALLSRAVVDPRKEGVRAELDRSHAYRKKLGDRRFIIPVKIDDVPFDELPPTIGNRTVIEAQANHTAALARVIEILEKDGVPRSATTSADALFRWQRAFGPEDQAVEHANDSLISNWFPIGSLPETIHFYEINRPLTNPITEPAAIAKEHPLPVAAYMRRLVAFAPWDVLQEPLAERTPIKLERSMPFEEFMQGGNADITLPKGEPGKILVSLLRQSFDRLASEKGLKPYSLSERKTAWWVPDGLMPENRAHFTRSSGLTGWRQLSGVYGRRDRLWHLGINAVPMLGDPHRLRLTPHVIYTDPAGEKEATAEFRRAHCKLWFNSKWRDLLYAAVTYLAGADENILLPLGGDAQAIVAASPVAVSLPVRPSGALEARSAAKAEEGDAADLDISAYADDPAFTHLIEDEDADEKSAADDESEDEEEDS
jgi:TIR domain